MAGAAEARGPHQLSTFCPLLMSAATSKPLGTWRARFTFDHVKPLIVCRGPIRQEAIDVFEQAGTQPCGILLSEKDSVVYPRALAPELRLTPM